MVVGRIPSRSGPAIVHESSAWYCPTPRNGSPPDIASCSSGVQVTASGTPQALANSGGPTTSPQTLSLA